jgi:hypothetical protein
MVQGRKKKIPTEMHPDLFAMRAAGKTIPEIHQWVLAQGIQCGDKTIYKILREETKEAKHAFVKKIVENAEQSVCDDLQSLDVMLDSLMTLYVEAQRTGSYGDISKMALAYHKFLDLKLKLVPIGINEKTDDERNELIVEMVKRLSH